MKKEKQNFRHPHDTVLSAGLRFSVELIAWVTGTWAIGKVSGWFIVPALIIMVGLPSIFSTINDKRQVIVATPGPIRVLIELFLYFIAAIAPWYVWSEITSTVAVCVVMVSLIAGIPRFRWLIKGAL